MVHITIVGAGNVGATIAHLVMERELGDVSLIDAMPGRALGKARDIAQAAIIDQRVVSIVGSDTYTIAKQSDIIVVTAGKTRQEGETREHLACANAAIVREILEKAYDVAPNALVIIVTNPVDALCHVAARIYPAQRVIGAGGILDGARLTQAVCEALAVLPAQVTPVVLGNHGRGMLPSMTHTTIDGTPLSEVASDEQRERIITETIDGGAQFAPLIGTSAYYAPASAVVKMITAAINNDAEPVICSAYLQGEYGIRDVFLGVPVTIGLDGVRRIHELPLNNEDVQKMRDAASDVLTVVEKSNNGIRQSAI